MRQHTNLIRTLKKASSIQVDRLNKSYRLKHYDTLMKVAKTLDRILGLNKPKS